MKPWRDVERIEERVSLSRGEYYVLHLACGHRDFRAAVTPAPQRARCRWCAEIRRTHREQKEQPR